VYIIIFLNQFLKKNRLNLIGRLKYIFVLKKESSIGIIIENQNKHLYLLFVFLKGIKLILLIFLKKQHQKNLKISKYHIFAMHLNIYNFKYLNI